MSSATFESPAISSPRGRRTDGQLARAAGRGDRDAFEALYDRHHAALLSFCCHMLGRLHDAEDVVQHTFLAADGSFRRGQVPGSVRAWLYTVARNRCVSVLRARRDDHELPDLGVPSTQNLAREVEQREELRELLADVRNLPDDQRAALLLAELGDLSHAEVGQVIGVRTGKVKALVFQARQTLMAASDARAISCRSIQQQLAAATGASRRRRHLRDHVARCEACRAYAGRVAGQRAALAAILPVVPAAALREGVLAGLGGGTAATGAGGAGVGLLAVKSTAAKVLAIAALGGAAAGGGTVAVVALEPAQGERPAARPAEPSRAAVTPAAGAAIRSATTLPALAAERAGSRPAGARGRGERAQRKHVRAHTAPRRTVTTPAKPERITRAGRTKAPGASQGFALGHAKRDGLGKQPPRRAAKPQRAALTPVPTPRKPATPVPARHTKPDAPRQSQGLKAPRIDSGAGAAPALENMRKR